MAARLAALMPEVNNNPDEVDRIANYLSGVSASEIRSHHQAAQIRGRVGHGPTGELFEGIVRRAEEVIARITHSVATVYEDTAKGLVNVAERTRKDDASARAGFERLEHHHEGPGGGPLAHGGGGEPGMGGGRRPSSLLSNGDRGVQLAGPGTTKRLGKLDEASVIRDADGRISSIDGRSVDAYLSDLSSERRGNYRALKENASLSRGQQGEVIAVGLDRRTGVVYEGMNGRSSDVIPRQDLHPTLEDSVNAAGKLPYDAHPLSHGEVKATNLALWERTAAGLPDGPEALGDLTMSPDQTYIGGEGRHAPFCSNCNRVLKGVHSVHGRFAAFPHIDQNLIRDDGLG